MISALINLLCVPFSPVMYVHYTYVRLNYVSNLSYDGLYEHSRHVKLNDIDQVVETSEQFLLSGNIFYFLEWLVKII